MNVAVGLAQCLLLAPAVRRSLDALPVFVGKSGQDVDDVIAAVGDHRLVRRPDRVGVTTTPYGFGCGGDEDDFGPVDRENFDEGPQLRFDHVPSCG